VGKQSGKTSRYKGVFWDKSRSQWTASIHVNNRTRYLGRFSSEEEGARAYDSAAKEAFKEFAGLNFPDELSWRSDGHVVQADQISGEARDVR